VQRAAQHIRALQSVWALLAAALLAGCARQPSGPDGAWWAGTAPEVRTLLGQLRQLEGTPLAKLAEQLEGALPDCAVFGAQAPDGDAKRLAEGVRCLAAGDPLEQARRAANADVAFVLPGSERAPLHGALRFEAGTLAADLHWASPHAEGVLGLLLPGDEPVGADRLASSGRIVHLRVRPLGGIDLAALLPEDSQGVSLFGLQRGLRSGLLASAVLDGTWEGAVYAPEQHSGMPGVAFALGFRLRDAASAAARQLVDDLQRAWPVHRSEFAHDAGSGACLLDLNVLPELAPCYVVTENAILLGWNPRSLERALGGNVARAVPAREEAGRLDVDLALMRRADEILNRHVAAPGRRSALPWPWTRLLGSGGVERGSLVVRLTLVREPQAAG
jgi:hypothetical protein